MGTDTSRPTKTSATVRAGEAFVAAFNREPTSPSDCAWLNGYVAALSDEPEVLRQDNEAHVARTYAAEAELARVSGLADKLWRLCVDEGFPWADGSTQDTLAELGLLYPHDMTGEDESEMCESCDGDCKVCYRAVKHVRDAKQPETKAAPAVEPEARLPEPPALTGYAERQLDAVDASVFNGDCYADAAGRARLRWYMQRWSRLIDAQAADEQSETKAEKL